MSIRNYKSVLWVPCKCPACGHEQEAEAEHESTHGAKCEECKTPTERLTINRS